MYFSFFLSKTASIPSSHGTVNSAIMIILLDVDHNIISDRREVMAISCGSRSALMFHSPPGHRRDNSLTLLLTNWISHCGFRLVYAGHLYWPCINAALKPETMCCKHRFWEPQSWQVSPELNQRCRFQQVGRVLYMALIRKLSLAWGTLHISAQLTAILITASQVVHLPAAAVGSQL